MRIRSASGPGKNCGAPRQVLAETHGSSGLRGSGAQAPAASQARTRAMRGWLKMTWNRWYAFKSYLRSTIWTVPLFAILAEQASFRVLMALTPGLGGIPGFTYSQEGTVAAMDWVIGSSITYMTFAFGMLLVAIQVSGGQLTPRIVATALLRDNAIRL